MLLLLLQATPTSAPRPPPSRPLDSAILRKGPITDATAHARVLLLARLEVWLQGHLGVGLEYLAFHNVPVLAMVLQEFVYDAFEKRWSIGRVRETLNGVAARYHWIRGQMSGPWRVVTTWAVKYPTTPHWPIPLFVLHALVYLAVGWDWHTVAALLLLGYYGLLRPGELIALRRQDILLMHENEVGAGYILVQILEPKTRFRRGRTHEYVKIEAPIEVLWFLELVLSRYPPQARLWPYPYRTFRTHLGHLSERLLGTTLGKKVLPSGLRTGGATWFFESSGEDVARLCWKGRWADHRMLPHYVQQLVVQKITLAIPAEARRYAKQLEGDLLHLLTLFAVDAVNLWED